MLTKQDILKKCQLKHEDVKAFDGVVRVREMTAGEYDRYQQSLVKLEKDGSYSQNLENITTLLVSICAVDENNNALMSQADWKNAPAKDVKKLFEVAQRLNGDTQEEREVMEGNS